MPRFIRAVTRAAVSENGLYVGSFPAEADLIVVDLRRPQFVGDGVDPAAFSKHLDQVKRRRKTLYESDGFLISGPSPA